VTLIIAVVTALKQRQQALDLQKEKQELQKENQDAVGEHTPKGSPAGSLEISSVL
jgi:hypothetical protein